MFRWAVISETLQQNELTITMTGIGFMASVHETQERPSSTGRQHAKLQSVKNAFYRIHAASHDAILCHISVIVVIICLTHRQLLACNSVAAKRAPSHRQQQRDWC